MNIRWTLEAFADLRDAHDFIAVDNSVAAAKLFALIKKSVEMLAAYPALGRAGQVAGTRELVVGRTPYFVVYAVLKESIYILAVLHSARRWPRK